MKYYLVLSYKIFFVNKSEMPVYHMRVLNVENSSYNKYH